MKNLKQFFISFMLIATMILGLGYGIETSRAAEEVKASESKASLNKTNLTLKVNGKKKLKVKGTDSKVKWSSSNSKIAKVKKGKVTAKSVGTCYIYAKVGNEKLRCKVTVKAGKANTANATSVVPTPTPTPISSPTVSSTSESISASTPTPVPTPTPIPAQTGTNSSKSEVTVNTDISVSRPSVSGNSEENVNKVVKVDIQKCSNVDSFIASLSELVNNEEQNNSYMDVNSVHSNRVIVGGIPDFSGFNPKAVIETPWGDYVVQFSSTDETLRFIETQAKNSNVSYVEEDGYCSIDDMDGSFSEDSSNSWGTDYIEAKNMAGYLVSNGLNRRIIVAIIDTGVDLDHEFIKNRLYSQGKDCVYNGPNADDKVRGHGTHVSGTVIDCTPDLDVLILPVKVFPKSGKASVAVIVSGIRYAVDAGADVINMSLGGEGCSKALDAAIEYAIANNVVVCVSAGNDTANADYYCPAHVKNCITVSAIDRYENLADFSNYGSCIDVAAPGVDIRSAMPYNRYVNLDGTSMASPHVAAAAAMLKMMHPTYSPAQIEGEIHQCTKDLGINGRDDYSGYGSLKLSKAIPASIKSIEIAELPQKQEYHVGEELIVEGLKIKANYSDDSFKLIDNGFICNPTSLTTIGSQEITVTYEGFTTKFSVLVKDIEVTAVSVATLPSKLEYFDGDPIDTDGLTLNVSYSNGKSEVVREGFTCTPLVATLSDAITTSEYNEKRKITVQYKENTTSFEIKVYAVYASRLELVSLPDKTQYKVQDVIDTNGLKLRLTYSNGRQEIITEGYKSYPEFFTDAGTQEVTISYAGLNVKFEVTVEDIVLEYIKILSLPTKMTYSVGEKLDTTGLTIVAGYSNGFTGHLDNGFTCTPTSFNTVGGQTITVIYGNQTAAFSINVVNAEQTIYFDGNGGQVSFTSKKIKGGQAIGQLPTAKRDYYTFRGWYDDFGNEVTENDVLKDTSDITLYAYWTKNDFGPFSDWSTTPVSGNENREVETREIPSTYHMITICCGDCNGYRCYLKEMKAGYTKRAEPYYKDMSKTEFDSCKEWPEGSWFTYATNVNGYIIGPGSAYSLPDGYTPWFISSVEIEKQYRYRDRIK